MSSCYRDFNQIITKQSHLAYWKETTKNQSKMECYLSLKREYKLAEYLNTVNDLKLRKALTRYRLSDHSLAIEKGRHRQTPLLYSWPISQGYKNMQSAMLLRVLLLPNFKVQTAKKDWQKSQKESLY